jgi:hypothetical protein
MGSTCDHDPKAATLDAATAPASAYPAARAA